MDFKIPAKKLINPAPAHPRVINMDDVKEETVSGHPDSVLYKLLVGPRGATRDAIDDAYVVTSLFLMDFAPGGTNFPHHHETAEEIYLVMDGEGEMVAGGGMDGVEGRHPSLPLLHPLRRTRGRERRRPAALLRRAAQVERSRAGHLRRRRHRLHQ